MPRPRLSPRAKADLKCLQAYVAQFDPVAARRLVRRIKQIIEMIGRQPLIGEARDEVHPGTRCFSCENYIVYYEPTRPRVSILRIVHGARDQEGLV